MTSAPRYYQVPNIHQVKTQDFNSSCHSNFHLVAIVTPGERGKKIC